MILFMFSRWERDQLLQPKTTCARRHQRQHHREAREDGARDEVGREDRRVPAGMTETAKSNDTIECTESTSGVREAGEDQVGRS
jgi:hypothetical protein